MEDYRTSEGRATSFDVPQVMSLHQGNADPIGALGIKRIGEAAMISTIASVMNAGLVAAGMRSTAL